MKLTIVTGFFLPVPPLRGGATEKIWHRLAELFAGAGHQVTFISRSWPGLADSEFAGGIEHRRIAGFDHSRRLALNLWRDLRWGFKVSRRLPAADVVLCNTVTLPVWLPRFQPAVGKVAVVLGRAPKGQIRWYGGISRLYATSTALAEQVARECPTMRERTRVMWNPIDWALHAEASGQGGPEIRIGYVGRIHPEKGLELLLRAATRLAVDPTLPPWRLELIGPVTVADGGHGQAWRDGLEARFRPALGSRLAFLPPEYDRRQLARRFGSFHIFCYPSLAETGETFGVSVAEAMAAGSAPVVSGLACFGDLVQDGQTGLVFNHREADAEVRLADALARLIRDGALRQEIAARAQAHVKRFDYPEVAAALLRDLQGLIDGDK